MEETTIKTEISFELIRLKIWSKFCFGASFGESPITALWDDYSSLLHLTFSLTVHSKPLKTAFDKIISAQSALAFSGAFDRFLSHHGTVDVQTFHFFLSTFRSSHPC